jgi:hypothetical protein
MDRDERLDAIEKRLEALEKGVQASRLHDSTQVAEQHAGETPALPLFDLALAGRTILILGGAFLLRAPTESASFPRQLGVAIGLLYAIAWVGAAIYAAHKHRRPESVFYSAAAAIIAYPIVWEATARFGVFTATTAAIILTILSVAFLIISSVYYLQSLAWIAAVGATCNAVLLAWSTKAVIPFVFELTIIGVVALILAMSYAGWLLALESDFFVIALIVMTQFDLSHDSRFAVVTCLLAFAVIWMIVITQSIPQSAAASLLGIGGASALALTADARVILWGIAAVIAAEIARRTEWRVFSYQSAIWGVMAMAASGVSLTLSPVMLIAAGLCLVAFIRERNLVLLAIAGMGAISIPLSAAATPLRETIILAIAAVILAMAGCLWRVSEASHLAIVLLVLTGLKVAVRDVRVGAAVTIFITLLVYGGAMLAIARLRRGATS